MTRLYIIDNDTGTEGYVPEKESHAFGREIWRAEIDRGLDAARPRREDPKASIPRWFPFFPFFLVLAVPAGMFCAALLLEWWLS